MTEAAYRAARSAGAAMALEAAIADAVADAPAQDLTSPRPAASDAGDHSDLSPREREVLALLAQRMTDLEIAERLFISPHTASTHVKRVLGKLGAANRREAAALAARHDLA
jgi:DNA-binding CsgD family transcriptional regulator